MIALSSKENLEIIENKVLMKLWEIRSKFTSSQTIIRNADKIANELKKL